MSKITPHNWRSRISQYEPEAFDIVQPGIGALALVKSEQFALLIAAAPDLLEALRIAMKYAKPMLELEKRSPSNAQWMVEAVMQEETFINAAIAKATGGAV
jgi:hypothetical protein